MPDPEARRTKLPAMFTGATKLTAAAGGVPERTADFEAVALWLAPGRDIGLRSIVRSGFSSVSRARISLLVTTRNEPPLASTART